MGKNYWLELNKYTLYIDSVMMPGGWKVEWSTHFGDPQMKLTMTAAYGSALEQQFQWWMLPGFQPHSIVFEHDNRQNAYAVNASIISVTDVNGEAECTLNLTYDLVKQGF